MAGKNYFSTCLPVTLKYMTRLVGKLYKVHNAQIGSKVDAFPVKFAHAAALWFPVA